MDRLTDEELAKRSHGEIKKFGLIAGINAKGFLIELDHVMNEEAGLFHVRVRKNGEPACRFRVEGSFDGEAADAAERILGALESLAYSSENASVAWSIQDGWLAVAFLTQVEGIGAATVCIRVSALRRPAAMRGPKKRRTGDTVTRP